MTQNFVHYFSNAATNAPQLAKPDPAIDRSSSYWRKPTMTSSRTILIEANCLFRQGLKHLLADTRFAIEAEFSTIKQAVEIVVDSGLVIIGEAEDLELLRTAYPE